jgi:3-deoxy-7-phosphoheptulonate synthase
MDGVAEVIYVTKPYKQVSREWKAENTIVTIAPGVRFGGTEVPVIAGPCSVESEEQILTIARPVKAAGAKWPARRRVQAALLALLVPGLGQAGAGVLAARKETGLAIVTEAMDEAQAELVAEYADCIQIGARNMQNYSLLKAVGRLRTAGAAQARPVGDHHRVPAQRRVHPRGGQHAT